MLYFKYKVKDKGRDNMLNLLTKKIKRAVSIFALAAFLISPTGYILQTATANASPAYASEYSSKHNDNNYRNWKKDKNKDKDKGHSTGEVVTAVLVGGLIGAVIAKNT